MDSVYFKKDIVKTYDAFIELEKIGLVVNHNQKNGY